MKPINQQAQKVFDKIMAELGNKDYTRIDNAPGAFMPLAVDRLLADEAGHQQFSLAHNGIQDGDVMADPDMVFTVIDGKAYPVSYQNDYIGVFNQADPRHPAIQRDMAAFAGLWLKNVARQQELFSKKSSKA